MADLGEWFDEGYRIHGEEAGDGDDHEEPVKKAAGDEDA